MTDLRGSPIGRVKAPGLSPYWPVASPGPKKAGIEPDNAPGLLPHPGVASPGLALPEIHPDDSPNGQSGDSEPDGGLSGQSREQISRALFKASKNRALPRAERERCNARNRNGTRCMAQGLLNIRGEPGRCRLHGGLSSGAKTAEGLQRQREGAAKSAQKQWALARAEGRRTLKKNPTRDADSPDSKDVAPAAASDVAHTSIPTRDRAGAQHGQPVHVSDTADAPDSAVAAAPEATIDVMALPCVDDFEMPPVRTEVRLPVRNRVRRRQDTPVPGRLSQVDLSAALAEAREFRRSGGLEAFHAEMMDFGREFRARGGTLVDNAANRRILREMRRDRKEGRG